MLTGQYAVNFLQGIQYGKDAKHTQIVGTCKHFVANSMENWYNYSRHNYDAMVSKADLADYYFPAFKACVMEGEAMSIMCSYASPKHMNQSSALAIAPI
jgi:beta-glucosidase